MARKKSMKIAASQKLRIKSRTLNKSNLFSKFASLIDVDECENLSSNLTLNLTFDDNKEPNKIRSQKLESKLKSKAKLDRFRDSPIKNGSIKDVSIVSKLSVHNLFKDELKTESNHGSTNYRSYNHESGSHGVNSSNYGINGNHLESSNHVSSKSNSNHKSNDNKSSKQKSNKKVCSKDKKSKKCKRIVRSNIDLYAETISKQLKELDVDFIKFIINEITPNLAFKLSSKIFNADCVSDMNDELDDEFSLTDRFLQLIQKEKDISNKVKQSILDYRAKSGKSKSGKCKKKKIKKKVESLNIGFDNLSLSTESVFTIGYGQPKKIDFK